MTSFATVRLPDERVWLRVAEPSWSDPLDPSYARERGGRWNPPDSFPALYLNGDVVTARMQIERMLAGSPVTVDDLDDEAYLLVAATLPDAQRCADATTPAGLRSLGLPDTYPRDAHGEEIDHLACQRVGRQVHDAGLDGVWCRSVCTADGRGRELVWFPSDRRAAARAVWSEPLRFGAWRYAGGWRDLGLGDQPEPWAPERRPRGSPPRIPRAENAHASFRVPPESR